MNKLKKILWITAITSSAIFGLSLIWYQRRNGLGLPLAWNPTLEALLQLFLTLSGTAANGALVYLIVLKFVKTFEAKPVQEFNKTNKYRSLRKMSLWIAAIPGLVLSPMLITFALAPKSGSDNEILLTISNFIGMISLGTLIPGALTMFSLLVLAIVKSRQKPTDSQSPTPKLLLNQILLAAITTAMPTIAFASIWLNTFKECQTNCFIFNDPIMIPLAIAYLALWLAQAIIWLGNRNKLAK